MRFYVESAIVHLRFIKKRNPAQAAPKSSETHFLKLKNEHMNHQQYLHKRPSGAKAEQQEVANEILKSFFADYPIDDTLEYLRQMMTQSYYTKKEFLNNVERANLIAFYEHLHPMIMATSILYGGK